jgi:cation diffusion facilitator family transporter
VSLELNDRKNLLAVNLSLAINLLLAVSRTGVGIAGHSPALLADGINTTSDVAYLIVVRIFMILARKPPDREHPFGHRQLESIAALVTGAFVMATAVTIFWNAIHEVYQLLTGQSEFHGAQAIALWVAVFSGLVKVGLYLFTRGISRQTGSLAVLALARDHRNDVFSVGTATLGLAMARAGYIWFDPAAAAVVALVILATGITILRDSSASLMDLFPSQPVAERIRALLEEVPGIDEVEEIRVHQIGHYLMVDVVIGVEGSLTVAAGNEIATRAEQRLYGNLEYLRHVSVHYHPSRAGASLHPGDG